MLASGRSVCLQYSQNLDQPSQYVYASKWHTGCGVSQCMSLIIAWSRQGCPLVYLSLIPSGLLSALACMHTRHSVNVSEFHLHSMFLVPCGSWQSRCEHLARPCHFPGVKLLSSGSLTRWWHGNDAVRALCLACPSCRAMACDEMASYNRTAGPDCTRTCDAVFQGPFKTGCVT